MQLLNPAILERDTGGSDPSPRILQRVPPPLPQQHGAAGHSPADEHSALEAQPPARQRRSFAHYLKRPLLQFGPILFAVSIVSILAYAWSVRHESYWTAENGVGYALGITGSLTMLTLFLYPLRKRFRALSFLGRVSWLFRMHMVLGILGPTLIILHCNFKLGSLNSQLALFTMLTVVASGIIGRYLYSQVHRGLYGRRAEARDILADVEALKHQLGLDVAGSGNAMAALDRMSGELSNTSRSPLSTMFSALTIGMRTRSAQKSLMREASRAIRRIAKLNGWTRRERNAQIETFRLHARTYFAAVKKAERLALFERLFAMWHVLHLPLFLMLIMSVIFHIIAVHQY